MLPVFSEDICYMLGFYLHEVEIRVLSAALGTQPILYVAQKIDISQPMRGCYFCKSHTKRGFLCLRCRSRWGVSETRKKVAEDFSKLLAVGRRYLPPQFTDFPKLLLGLPRVCGGYAFAPETLDTFVTSPLQEALSTSQRRLREEFYLEISEPDLRSLFATRSLGECTSAFSRLVLGERCETLRHADMVALAMSVRTCLTNSTIRELEFRISDNTMVSDLEKRKLTASPSVDNEPEKKRLRVPLGTLRGQVIDETLVIPDEQQCVCRALVQNEKFKHKFPLEWRELKRLL